MDEMLVEKYTDEENHIVYKKPLLMVKNIFY